MKKVCEIIVEEMLGQGGDSSSGTGCGIGRLKVADERERVRNDIVSVLVRSPCNKHVSTIAVPEEDYIIIPAGVGRGRVPFIPSLVFSLWAWDKLSLELGDAAVFTGETLTSSIVGQVALWRGGCPVISLHRPNNPVPGIEYPEIGIQCGESLLEWFREKLNGKSGFAAIDLDGRVGVVDLLLEALPRWGRLMLAGDAKQPVTVDYYNNIHRKGVQIISTRFEPAMIFENNTWPCVGEHLRRAFRILQNEKMAQELLAASQGVRVADLYGSMSG